MAQPIGSRSSTTNHKPALVFAMFFLSYNASKSSQLRAWSHQVFSLLPYICTACLFHLLQQLPCRDSCFFDASIHSSPSASPSTNPSLLDASTAAESSVVGILAPSTGTVTASLSAACQRSHAKGHLGGLILRFFVHHSLGTP